MDEAELRTVMVGARSEPEQPYVAVWNKNRDSLESIVLRSKSHLVQHKDAFGAFIDAVKEKEQDVEGSVENFGGVVVLKALFKNKGFERDGDSKYSYGVRLKNSYNTSGGPHFKGEGYTHRDICDNGMIIGSIGSLQISTKHCKVADLQKAMLEFVGQATAMEHPVLKFIEEAEEDIFNTESELKETLIGEIHSKKRAKKVLELIESKDPTKYTRFEVYNALTNYATHEAKNTRETESVQRLAQKILVTNKENLKKAPWTEKKKKQQ